MRFELTDKLTVQERPVLAILGKEYEVDNTKDTVLRFQEMADKLDGAALIDQGVALFLGEEAAGALGAMGLSWKNWQRVFMACVALATEDSYEAVEERFQKGTVAV